MDDMPPEDFGWILGPATVATHSFKDAPALDVILVPGGMGNFANSQTGNIEVFGSEVDGSDDGNRVREQSMTNLLVPDRPVYYSPASKQQSCLYICRSLGL